MDKLSMQTPNLTAENVKKVSDFLKSVFPNCVKEAADEEGNLVEKIDFDLLKTELGNETVEGLEERYRLDRPGKKRSILKANTPITKTLRPVKEDSVDWDNTGNLYIEGDNFEVLKILQESYLGKIKMIYIDPPYNTGNDFVYNDDFAEDSEEYKERTEQDAEGYKMVKNTESNGRFHSDRLSMMYERLRVARDFLSDDGIVFLSIDDNEKDNLNKILDEIYGEDCYIATFPWRKRTAKSDVPFGVSQDYERIICYSKSNLLKVSIEGKGRRYFETPDFPGRPRRIHDMTKQTTASERPNSYFTMINPKNGEEFPCDPNRTRRITKDTFQKYYDANEIVFPGDYDFLHISKPQARYFKDKDMEKDGDDFGKVAVSTKLPDDIGMSQNGTKEIKEIFGCITFPFPKPSTLIKYLIKFSTSTDDIILDFFSGSSTTAHACMQLNAEDGGNRKYIMVQLPELCDEQSEAYKAGYKNICEIGKERIRRAGKKIKEETNADIDYGFRVYRVDESCMKDVYYHPSKAKQEDLGLFVSNIKDDRTSEDLLTQVILNLGLTLDLPIEEKKIGNNKVFYVAGNSLVACFDENVDFSIIEEIAKDQPLKMVLRDSSFKDDADRINFENAMKELSKDTIIKVI